MTKIPLMCVIHYTRGVLFCQEMRQSQYYEALPQGAKDLYRFKV